MELTAAPDDDGRRLDRILRRALPRLPLSALHRLLRQGKVLVDGIAAAASDRVFCGQVITLPGAEAAEAGGPVPLIPPARGKDLDILFEGAGLLILNKSPGIAVHGRGSLEEKVRSRLRSLLPPSLSFRPGPLHRLDKPTSGIIVFSTSLEGARTFSGFFQRGREEAPGLVKRYLALADGVLEEGGLWEDRLYRDKTLAKTFVRPEGLPALTAVFPRAWKAPYTLLELELFTGRTHQIRVQAASRGHPLAGDRKYGGSPRPGGFLLHAWSLEFKAETGLSGLPRKITAPPPEAFREGIKKIFGEKVLGEIESPEKPEDVNGL